MSINNFHKDDTGVNFYTGLETITKCFFVFSTLGPAAYCLNYVYHKVTNISVPDQFFLVLIKLRRTNFEFSRLFNVSEKTVSNVFFTWILFMCKQWKEVDLWPTKSLVSFVHQILNLYIKFPNTRVIVDGTECPIKKPKLPKSQQVHFQLIKIKH